MSNQEKTDLIDHMLSIYTPENRMGWCKLATIKYRFQNYRLSEHDIKPQDYIVQDQTTLEMINGQIRKKSCSNDELRNIMERFSVDDLIYIGI